MDAERIDTAEDLKDEDQRRMDNAAKRLLQVPAVAVKLHEFDDGEVPARKQM